MLVSLAWDNEDRPFTDKSWQCCLAPKEQQKWSLQRQWQWTLISLSYICWLVFTQCLDWGSQVSRADIFLSTAYFPLLFRTFPWVQTVKWWIDSSGIGREQQASISEWRRGVYTELPSLHLASPQPRLGRQLQLSAYWVWQHKYWLSATVVSLHTIMETKTGIHAHRHSLISLCCLLCISLLPLLSLSKWTPCLCVWDWPLRCSVWQRARYWSSLCSHCAKAIQMPVMPAGHARCVRMLV